MALAWLLGEARADDRQRLEAELRLRGDAAYAELRELSDLVGALFEAVGDGTPPEALRSHVLEAIEGSRPSAGIQESSSSGVRVSDSSGRRPRLPWALAAAAMIVALGTGLWAFELKEERAGLRAQLQDLRSRLLASDSLLVEADRRLSVVEGARSEIRLLAGTGGQTSATARVFIDPATGRALLYAYDLPILPPSSIYQLWAIRAGSPEPLGTFRAGPGEASRLELENARALADVNALAVTVEPVPGSPQPTGEMVLSSVPG